MGNAPPENVEKIHAIVSSLTEEERETMNVAEVEGQIHLNHWYVMISARLSATDRSFV
jgi:hypothetical protein